jgi:hypothetical protein
MSIVSALPSLVRQPSQITIWLGRKPAENSSSETERSFKTEAVTSVTKSQIRKGDWSELYSLVTKEH